MECEESDGNPWASLSVKARSPQKSSSKIIDNRFPNNFKKSSSIVTCNICQILLLKSQTLHHFKAFHNKKLAKKCSKYIIPYNAVEVYDLLCEHKSKKLLITKKSNGSNKNNDLVQIKKPKLDITNNRDKELMKAIPKIKRSSVQLIKIAQPNGAIKKEKESKNERLIEENVNIFHKVESESKSSESHSHSDTMQLENKIIVKPEVEKEQPNNDLKLNIKVNSNGLLTSTIKMESNIFDRMSTLCENSVNIKPIVNLNFLPKVTIKQTGFDKSYGCAIFTDEHNNSILIDNDKDELEDFDCCESSISNDSAYYSLPNTTTANSLSSQHARKSSNFYDSGIAPPLVTAYQFSSSANTISYNNSNSDTQKRFKPSSTMVVTRNSIQNSTLSTKFNVKHRFYVSSHSNQNILDSIRKSSNLHKINSGGLLKESGEFISNPNNKGLLHNIQSDNLNFLNFDCKSGPEINCQLSLENLSGNDDRDVLTNSSNGCQNRTFIRQLLSKNSVWDCIQEQGIKSSLLIPKRLCWNYTKSRYKTKSKYTKDPMVLFNSILPRKNISDNPLLSSYTINSSENDSYLQSNINNGSEIVLDYPFPDRNQMSFQQRLLERGVISQRDINRSQRCLSLNNHTLSRKNVKSNSYKQTFIDNKRIINGKTCSIKSQPISQMGKEITGSQNGANKINYSYIDPVIKDNQKNRTILLDRNLDIISNPVNSQRKSWIDIHKLPKAPNVNSNIATFQGLCLSQNNKPSKPNGTIVIGPNSSFNTVLSHMDSKSENHISNYKFHSDNSLVQFNNNITSSNSGVSAQNISNDTICFSQSLNRKYSNHSLSCSNNRCNCYSQNFANHSTNVIHTKFDR